MNIPSKPPTTAPLAPSDVEWVRAQMQDVCQFVNVFSPRDADKPIGLDCLDRAYAAWFKRGVRDQEEIHAAVNCVGVAFGENFIQSGIFQWVLATDEFGTDIAVLGFPGQGDVLIHPSNFVYKRWERGEVDFLQGSFTAIAGEVRKLQESYGNKPKPLPAKVLSRPQVDGSGQFCWFGKVSKTPSPVGDPYSLDLLAKRKEGGVDLILVVAAPLRETSELLDLLARKFRNYCRYVKSTDFSAEFGDPNQHEARISIRTKWQLPARFVDLMNAIAKDEKVPAKLAFMYDK